MIEISVIANKESGKTVGIMIHDAESGRILFKVRPTDASLMQVFNIWQNKPLIETSRETINGKKMTRRYRILSNNPVYGRTMADKVVKPPYIVRTIITSGPTDSLDLTLDGLYQDLVDQGKPVPIESVSPPRSGLF